MKRDERIKRIIVETGLPENIVTLIINDMLERTSEAMRTNDTIELSGFGKFILNKKRIHRDLLNSCSAIRSILEEGKKTSKIETLLRIGNELLQRNDDIELEADFRRLEEQAYSEGRIERIN